MNLYTRELNFKERGDNVKKRIICLYIVSLIFILMNIVPVQAASIPEQNFSSENSTLYELLKGKWLYFDEQLYDGNEAQKYSEQATQVNVPVEFDELGQSASGYGTFALQVRVPERYVGQVLAIRSPYEYSAVKIFVNGQEILESGKVGTHSAAHETMLESKIGYFEVEQTQFVIAVQISSFEHIRGGFANPLVFGEAEEVVSEFNNQLFPLLFFIGILMVSGLLTLFIGLLRKEEKAFLAFGFFCFIVAIRTMFTVPFIYRIMPMNISYVNATRIEYVTTVLVALFYILFIYYLYKEIFSKKILVANNIFLLLLNVFIIFTQPVVFQKVFFNLMIVEVLVMIYSVYVLFKAYKQQKTLALPTLIGISITFMGMTLDYISGLGIINIFPLTLFCITILVMILVMTIAFQYSNKFKETEKLNGELSQMNASLDRLVHERTEELFKANSKLKWQATHDGLTGIYNRQHFNDSLSKHFKLAQQGHQSLSIIMFDLDEFKKYNDYYGHVMGDEILFNVVTTVKEVLTKDAIFARYGGEEFAIILPNYTSTEAKKLAETVHKAVENEQFEHNGRAVGLMTISVGGATMDKSLTFTSENQLLEAADQQLYESKHQGRNQVHFLSVE